MSETPEMVKRVAQAMAAAEGFDDADRVVKVYVPLARAAIEAMREPTDAMVDAMEKDGGHSIYRWPAAIDAALTSSTA